MNTTSRITLCNTSKCKNRFEMLQRKMRCTRFYTAFIMMFAFSASFGQSINKNWKEALTLTLDQFLTCATNESDKTACASFIEKSISDVYKLDALSLEASTKSTPSLVNIKGNQWSVIGMAFDQKALEKAQLIANENRAVIAVYKPSGNGIKHIALILPGELQYSGSWGYKVPNSASFFITTPDKSYVNKGLSYAFAKSMLLYTTLYVRIN